MNDYRYLFGQELQSVCRECPGAVWWVYEGHLPCIRHINARCILCDPTFSTYRDSFEESIHARYYRR